MSEAQLALHRLAFPTYDKIIEAYRKVRKQIALGDELLEQKKKKVEELQAKIDKLVRDMRDAEYWLELLNSNEQIIGANITVNKEKMLSNKHEEIEYLKIIPEIPEVFERPNRWVNLNSNIRN